LLESYGQKPFPPEVAAEVGIQICRGIAHSHSRKDLKGRPMGIVHGDISPTNIMVSLEGQVKLADFGLSRIREIVTDERLITGKYSYMSPEQASGTSLSPASDIFSLGLVLYEMLTGHQTFPLIQPIDQMLTTIKKCMYLPILKHNPALTTKMVQFINRALSPKPEGRFFSALEMAQQLTASYSPCGPERLSEFVKQHTPSSVYRLGVSPEPTKLAHKPVRSAPKRRISRF